MQVKIEDLEMYYFGLSRKALSTIAYILIRKRQKEISHIYVKGEVENEAEHQKLRNTSSHHSLDEARKEILPRRYQRMGGTADIFSSILGY